MKTFTLTLAVLGLACGLVPTAQATEIGANRGQRIELGAINGVAYYTVEKDGYRVVATLAKPDSEAVRFETVLAPGQTVVLSSSASTVVGGAPGRIEISRRNDRVEIVNAPVTN